MRAAAGVSFSGHETFPFRYAWLKKAVDAVAADPGAFGAPDAMVRLGVGKNMVASIRHWGLVTGMLEERVVSSRRRRDRRLNATDLGFSLFRDGGWDPFLEDPGTLWLLHWRLASAPQRATTWWWVFNQYPGTMFTRADLQQGLETLCALRARTRVTAATLKRDLDVFLRTYAPQRRRNALLEDTLDCPLVELGLVRATRQPRTHVLVRSEQPTLPDEIFVHALAEYLERRTRPARTVDEDRGSALPLADSSGWLSGRTVSLEDLARDAGAPGRVFCLDETGLLARLDRIEELTGGGIVYDETAGLKQIYVASAPDPIALLERYYGEPPAGGGSPAGTGPAVEGRSAVAGGLPMEGAPSVGGGPSAGNRER